MYSLLVHPELINMRGQGRCSQFRLLLLSCLQAMAHSLFREANARLGGALFRYIQHNVGHKGDNLESRLAYYIVHVGNEGPQHVPTAK